MESAARNHEHAHDVAAATETCPWCGSEISREEFLRIEARIRAEEQRKLDDLRAQLHREHEEARQALLRETEERIAQAGAEHEQRLSQNRQEGAAREAALRQEFETAAGHRVHTALEEQRAQLATGFEERAQEIQAASDRAREDLLQQVAELKTQREAQTAAERQAEERAQAALAQATSEKDTALRTVALMKQREATVREEAKAEATRELETAMRDQAEELAKERNARVAAVDEARQLRTTNEVLAREHAQQLESRLADQRAAQQIELDRQRKALEEDRDRKLLEEKAAQGRKNLALEEQVQLLQRQLQEKTANELGDGAEVDLFKTLQDDYPEDKVTRIKKGLPGADIRFEVLYRGESIGKIIIDSKNRQQWRSSYVDKLREDQREEAAEHAILSSLVFPSGAKQLCVQDGVIVSNPTRVSVIVGILRDSMIRLHQLCLSKEEREGKVNRLYEFINSERFRQLFGRADEVVGSIENIDAEEKKAHDKVWERRGALVRSLQHALREVDCDIRAIVEGTT